ncbi:ABC transporter ATP-binding protein [Arcanobacterium phocae]|uniref:ABC transporter ATP-binding protein n=1 Tax=Arcanobacterium phocae TaxID=131112 RepID=UPI001C0F1A90|nr:ABC transporter ATP-binding protein [Arcanobacterium phocae]
MKNTMNNIVQLMVRLHECLPLFIASTIVTMLAQLAVVGAGITSVWISTSFLLDTQAELTGFVALLGTLVLTQAVATLCEVWWSHEVAYRILHILRRHIYAAISRIAPSGLHGRRTADVASAAMDDAEKLEWFYAHTASTAVCTVVTPSILISILYVLIGPLALVMIIPIALMVVFPLLLMPIQRQQGKILRSGLVDLRATVLDSIQGQRELRSLGMTEHQHAHIGEIADRVQHIYARQMLRRTWESTFASVITAVGTTIILIILTGRVLDGHSDGQILPIAIVTANMCVMPTMTFVAMMGRIGEIGACAERINTIIAAPDPIPAAIEMQSLTREHEEGTLVSENVIFSYANEPVVNGVSLVAKPNQTIALVGRSGAGKTTFANLVMRFLDPQHGELRFNGTNLRSYGPDDYRKQLALVPQDCHIFAGTVRHNLALAAPNASDEEIWESLRAAHIDHLVTQLGGLDAHIGDRGTTLSGGERQRIGIARAFLRNPEMLILDEPLANIDPILESSIAHNVRTLRNNRTTIVIAHRLTSILMADHIILLENGQICAQGTHEQLMHEPSYQELLGDQLS